jgi:hypothetical protein
MLKEIKDARQVEGEPSRRWFADNTLDLIVWHSAANMIIGFQLCYQKGTDEHALTWLSGKGYSHNRVDDGETMPCAHKMTPILVVDGTFDRDRISQHFETESREIDPDVIQFVTKKLLEYPST